MSASLRIAWLGVLAGAALACSAQGGTRSPEALGDGPACGALGEIADLSHALGGGTLRDAGDPRHALARSDELLGYLVALEGKLEAADPGRRASLRTNLDRLTAAVRAQRDEIDARMATLAESHEAALAQLHAAAICQGVDQRHHIRERNQEILGSEACREPVRLWRAAGGVDLTSEIDVRSVASHIRELGLGDATGAVRDRLSTALVAHADELRALQRVLDPEVKESLPIAREVVTASFELVEDLDDSMTSCLDTSEPTDRVRSRGAKPRVATLIVHPVLPEQVEGLVGPPASFGSGFVVQWQTTAGDRLTRIITNAHVMHGAPKAELHPGDEALEPSSTSSTDRPPPIVAKLVRALPYDDIAVLELEDSERARELFGEGLRLRHAKVREQEAITAAGFPGVGGMPSYQISAGVVSNARFGGSTDDPTGVTGFIQHTAPIDPGNSGGPLLDRKGRVIGMNTLKIWGRENMGLAIPVPRIQFALLRADEPLRFEVEHARAACNLVLGALGSDRPEIGTLERLGLALYDGLDESMGRTEAARHRDRVLGEPLVEADLVRVRIYGALRSELEDEGGVGAYATCREIAAVGGTGTRFVASFRTRTRSHELVLAEEDGRLRVVEVRDAAGAERVESSAQVAANEPYHR